MPSQSLLLYALIVTCEVVFWLMLLGSLAARYGFRSEAVSRGFLYALPAIDLLLIAFTAMDLKAGTVATIAHGLAAAYVGFTVAFGSVAVRWADSQFAYRFASGPQPPPAPTGWSAVHADIGLWLRCMTAWIIALALIELLIAYVGIEEATMPLRVWYKFALGSVILWFIFGPAWSLLLVRRRAR